MDFKEYIQLHRQEIYSTICNYVQIKNPIEHYKITRDYSDRQGSYRRPGLILLTGQMLGAKIEDLIIPAAAMQLSEDWILVHDDVEDHSELRRGKTSLNKLYGLEIAVNAGDAGHIIMWKMLKDYLINNKKGALIYDKFIDILEKTVEGQFLDIDFIYNKKNFENINEDLYFKIINSKTCYYTVYGPMQLGAISAGSSDEILKIIEEIGTPAGIAFQIIDDILDLTADNKAFGKQKYGDLYEGKITLIILNAYKNATNEEKNKILVYILKNLLKLWHPFMPFVTEKIWGEMGNDKMLIIEDWPEKIIPQPPFGKLRAGSLEKAPLIKGVGGIKNFELIKNIITAIRNARAENKVEPAKKIKAVIYAGKQKNLIEPQAELIKNLRTRISDLDIRNKGPKIKNAIYITAGEIEIYLIGAVDEKKEKERIKKEIENLEKIIKNAIMKLGNNEFVSKAPEKVVNMEKDKLKKAESELKKLIK